MLDMFAGAAGISRAFSILPTYKTLDNGPQLHQPVSYYFTTLQAGEDFEPLAMI